MVKNIISIDNLIGMKVLSRSSGNQFGRIQDVYFDPAEGVMLGIIIRTLDEGISVANYADIFSFGQDAVMTQSDEVIKETNEEWLNQFPLIKRNLNGTSIFTESGNKLGQISNVFISLTPPPFLIYEVRESLFDKLLGRGFFILALFGRAFSSDSKRIVVSDESQNLSAYNLEDVLIQKENLLKQREEEELFPDGSIVVRTYDEEEETVAGTREERTIVTPRKTIK